MILVCIAGSSWVLVVRSVTLWIYDFTLIQKDILTVAQGLVLGYIQVLVQKTEILHYGVMDCLAAVENDHHGHILVSDGRIFLENLKIAVDPL